MTRQPDEILLGFARALRAAGVPCGKVRSVPEALADPQVAARGMLTHLPHPRIPDFQAVATPIRLSETPAGATSAPPLLGQHTDAVLADLGYAAAQIEALRAAGVV